MIPCDRRTAAVLISIVWVITSAQAPLVALHVAYEHHDHVPSPSAAHGHEPNVAEHHADDHHHPQLSAGVASAASRLPEAFSAASPPAAAGDDPVAACPLDPPQLFVSRHLGPAPPRSPVLRL